METSPSNVPVYVPRGSKYVPRLRSLPCAFPTCGMQRVGVPHVRLRHSNTKPKNSNDFNIAIAEKGCRPPFQINLLTRRQRTSWFHATPSRGRVVLHQPRSRALCCLMVARLRLARAAVVILAHQRQSPPLPRLRLSGLPLEVGTGLVFGLWILISKC